MSQRPRIQVTQTQRLQLNLGLQSSIRILRADSTELTRYLEEQAAENPHLKLDPPPMPVPGEWLPRWSQVFVLGGAEVDRAGPGPSLMAHVLSVIDHRIKGGTDRRIALALAEALEPSGWVGTPLATIAADLGVPSAAVEAILLRLQEIEPAGLFARDLAECLRLQAQEEGSYDAVMAQVLDRLDLLAAGNLSALAARIGVADTEIALRFRQIRAMNPKPGTEFDALAVSHPREPDLLAKRSTSGGWEVALNRSSQPALRIDEGAIGGNLGEARAVQRMVEARNSTVLRVGRAVLQRQVQALEVGARALVPMTMAEIAGELGLHESSVSRVVAGTSVDTPHGMWWLRRLFSQGVGADQVSGAALRDRLARLVAGEPRGAPLSDDALAGALSTAGVSVARRTVAKYRAMLGIGPAHRRRLRP
ncbi:MAG: RNA polymerase sigma-54 factor [Candidatus Saccharibacteria bacterium]|nr:RNA polymerase sigma-54 factor [Pseudorhodobacter sp.]